MLIKLEFESIPVAGGNYPYTSVFQLLIPRQDGFIIGFMAGVTRQDLRLFSQGNVSHTVVVSTGQKPDSGG